MDRLKHKDIKFLQGNNKVKEYINSNRFKKLTILNKQQELYEIEL